MIKVKKKIIFTFIILFLTTTMGVNSVRALITSPKYRIKSLLFHKLYSNRKKIKSIVLILFIFSGFALVFLDSSMFDNIFKDIFPPSNLKLSADTGAKSPTQTATIDRGKNDFGTTDKAKIQDNEYACLLYTSPSPRDRS